MISKMLLHNSNYVIDKLATDYNIENLLLLASRNEHM